VLVRDERHSLPGRAVLQSDRTGRLYVLQESTFSRRVDRLTRLLLGVLSNRRVFDRPESDSLALDVVAGERQTVLLG
jgi:hypothetical protein